MSFVGLRGKLCLPLLAVAVMLGSMLATAGRASAEEGAAPGWEVDQLSYPTELRAGSEGYLVLQVYNVGRQASSGQITVTDVLPAGMIATEAGYDAPGHWKCSVGQVVKCVNSEHLPEVKPGQMELLAIAVRVPANASGSAANQVTVSGGGALGPANATQSIEYGSGSPGFGYQSVDGWFSNENGTLDTQAGSHPYALTISQAWNNVGEGPDGEVRDITVNLPRGLIGNPTAMPRCTSAQLNAQKCPADTQVGIDHVALGGAEALNYPEGERPEIYELGQNFIFEIGLPVYNIAPPPGVPSQLGFSLGGTGVRINTFVRSGSDYGLRNVINNIPQLRITYNTITIWGEPGDQTHDYQRAQGRPGSELIEYGVHSSVGRVPYLTVPTACEGPQAFVDSTNGCMTKASRGRSANRASSATKTRVKQPESPVAIA